MSQSEMDFGIFATSACNYARRGNLPPIPDPDGLFDSDGVAVICGRRQCHVGFSSEFTATVQFKEKKVPLTAIAPGRWDPVTALSACTLAHGNRVFKVNPHKARFTNPGGLDELKIARVLGADGVIAYRARGLVYAGIKAGDPTYAFENIVVREQKNTSNYSVRRGLRALEDAGLVKIKLGPRGGMARATFTWTPLAYLPAPSALPAATTHDDDMALEALAAGIS